MLTMLKLIIQQKKHLILSLIVLKLYKMIIILKSQNQLMI